MDPSRSQQAEQLFIEALELEPSARGAFLDRTCGADTALRDDVKSLLDASARSADYFEQLPERMGIAKLMSSGIDGDPEGTRVVGAAGEQFGQYTLTEPVGSGGMGTVWRAARSDGRFEGEVAVKLLSRLAGGAAPERFALEGQYLAKLTHPNIARLLDAGVGPNEQPYLVLEYIKGLPIDQYCDEHALNIEARIHLFLSVLDAVAHAHARLIVHRDIKPSNVQVAVDGTVKLLDFGVAKLLSDEAVAGNKGLTREMGAALTPEYAAPEQLNGDTITTATDVYSLGLLLWLLVTGSNPRETSALRSLAELRALAQKEPTRLLAAVTSSPSLDELGRLAKHRNTSASELLKTLRSDLDNIVRKALAVEPDERYATVADFAQDLRSYLRHEPVTAQAPTIRYRAQKFLRRHRGGVLAAALTLLTLLSAAAITAWQGMEAQRQRDAAVYQQQRAEQALVQVQAQRDRATRLSEFLAGVFRASEPGEARGRSVTARELLDQAVERLHVDLADQPLARAEMEIAMGQAYAALGLFDPARDLYTAALETRRTHLSGEDPELIEALDLVARVHATQGRRTEALALAEQVLVLREQTLGAGHPQVANSLAMLARLRIDLMEYGAARDLLKRALAIQQQAPEAAGRPLANTLRTLGLVDTWEENHDSALGFYRQAMEAARAGMPPDDPWQFNLYDDIGIGYAGSGQIDRAIEVTREGLDERMRILGPDHVDVSYSLHNLARLLTNQGELDAAEEMLLRGIAIRERALGPQHVAVAYLTHSLANVHLRRNAPDAAEPWFLRSLEILRTGLGESNIATHDAREGLAIVRILQGRHDEAIGILEESVNHGWADRARLASPPFDSLGDQPRFRELLARLNEGQ